MPPINDYDDDRHKREELARRERRKNAKSQKSEGQIEKKERGKSTLKRFSKNTEVNEKNTRPHRRQHHLHFKLFSSNEHRDLRLHLNLEMLLPVHQLVLVLLAQISTKNCER